MKKKPWERRLKDLSHLLSNCAATYFDPEMFRLNLNQFLQTSRTVTFIIQKNKKEIKNSEVWYTKNFVEKWREDPIMTWAKDSRNAIEKEGDLEMFSEAKATLIFSYVEEQDIEVSTTDKLLGIGVKQLVRLAQKKLPSGFTDSAVIKSERRWVANTLKNHELLHVLTIIYGRVYDCCKSLGLLIGNPIDSGISTPSSFDELRNETRRVTYFKLKDFSTGKISFISMDYNKKMIPKNINEQLDMIGKPKEINSLGELVNFTSKIAEVSFLNNGFHIQTLLFFNRNYQVIDLLNTEFEDQADKYIFWRFAADRAKIMNAYGFVWVSELWLRNTKSNFNESIHKMPIIGERLQVVGIDRKNNQKSISWNIIRESKKNKPSLYLIKFNNENEGKAYFMRPVLKAIGGDTSMLND